MARSLDGLIRHLVDQIALCGEHGTSPLDFISHVKNYYIIPIEDSQTQDGDYVRLHSGIPSNVDRPFLEKVWKWLLQNPDIRLGSHAAHKQLKLSEVEAHNATIEQSEQSIPVSEEVDFPKAAAPLHPTNTLITVPDDDITQTHQNAESASAITENAAVLQQTKFNPGIRLYASKNRMWHTLTGHAPDSNKVKSLDFICLSIIAASGPKGISQHDLIRISGQDKRSLPARTDRLHDSGYVEKKNVSVYMFDPKRLVNTSKCTLKRFINETPNWKEQTSDPGSAPAITTKRAKKKVQKEQVSQVPGQSSSAVAQANVSRSTALLEDRKIPLWKADRPINNQIFDLVDRAGTKGMSMIEIRDALMGDYIKKPLDEYVSRLVQSWQISQPLHIRHLSIVRDTVLKGKTQIYNYYTYDNFKKLVEGGTGFWEAVTTIPSETTIGKNIAASLNAKPDVDEYGFPRLEGNLFQGRHNDATLEECVSALNFGPLHICASDPILRKQADGNHSVWYRSQQQHSVTTGNGLGPKKASSTPSRATSTKTRATEPQKVAQSTPSSVLSTESHILEPEKVAVSKSPGVVPAQIQRRKRARKTDSKPLGRPRKYRKTGIPANFDTMTPDEVDHLLRSQEMFEKYEIVKIEKEIFRRSENGESPTRIAYEVLAEWDNSRKREGELPLPKTSRAQVLHNFAEIPLLEQDPDESNLRGRHEDTLYRPSMAAHTYSIPTLRKETPRDPERKDPEEEPPVLPTRTREHGQAVLSLEPKIYLPSVAAHSWPYVRPPSSAVESSAPGVFRNTTKLKQGRQAKPRQLMGPHPKDLPPVAPHSGSSLPPAILSVAREGQKRKRTRNIQVDDDEKQSIPLRYQYLPSIAAHSGSFLPPDASRVAKAGQKRKRIDYVLSQHDEHHKTPSTSSVAAKTPRFIPAPEALLGIPNMQLNSGNEGMYPGWEKFMLKYYQQHLGRITRPNTGIFVGETAPRRKRPCEPRDFRPTHFKLMVFKSIRLGELDWFVKKTIASEHISSSESRAQTPSLQVAQPTQSKPVVFKSIRLGELDWFVKKTIASEHIPSSERRAQTPSSQVAQTVPVRITQSPSEGQPDLSKSTSLPLPTPSHVVSQPNSSYNSLYADVAAMKRKRTTSPQPTRGATSFDPFSASSYNRLWSPSTQSLKAVTRPSTPPRTAILSPAIDDFLENAFTRNEAPTPTPERQPDTQELSGPTPNALDFNDPNTTQSKSTLDPVVQPSQSSTQEVSKPSDKESISKVSRRGGSTAMLRKAIIMGIMEKCEGVFPSHKEMSLPFAAEWKRRGQQGTPEAKTISNAVNALIKEHKLRQITFAAQTRQGAVVTKNMLIVPTIDITDPKVKEIQTYMVAYHPRHFVPMAVLPQQDYQNAGIQDKMLNSVEALDQMAEGIVQKSSALEAPVLRRLEIAKKVMDGKEKAAMARLRALKERDQEGPGHADSDEPSTKPFIPPGTKDAAHVASGFGREIVPKATSRRSGGRRGQKRVERLASVRKRISSQMTSLPTVPFNSASNSVSLTWLPPNYAFSDFNFEEQRPAVLMADANFHLQTGTSEVQWPLDPSNKARQRIRKIAENAARIEHRQAQAKSNRSSLLHMDVDSARLESPYAPICPPSPPWQAPTSRFITLSDAGPRNQPFLHTPPADGKAILNRTVRQRDNLRLESVGPETMAQMPPTSEPLRLESLSTIASPSPESPLSYVSGSPVVAHAKNSERLNQRVLLVSFMDPVHYFHRATGTFSVTFSGLRPPRGAIAHQGTALHPYDASLRILQPYNPYPRNVAPSSLRGSRRTGKTLFNKEVDDLLRRELEMNELNGVVLVGSPFVNHMFSHAHQTVQSVEADMEVAQQVTVRLKDGRLTSRPFHSDNATRLRILNSIFSTGSRGIDLANAESRPSLKRRRLTSVVGRKTQEQNSEQVDLDHEHRPSKLRRVRGPRQAKSLGENGEERLLTAVMVIRALTGGLDKRIDWVLVAKVFEPTYTQMFVHSRWALTMQKYKLVLPRMESDFQNVFASAYEKGTVPAIDYDNLEDYDWKWLVEWTMANIDTPTQSLPELPMERSDFDVLYTLDETSNNEINEVYEIDGSSSIARRLKVMHRDPYVLPLVQGRQRNRPEGSDDLETAKSWIRANIMTPESTYNPSAARAKLSTFPDRTVEDALKQLLLDRVLTQENKGRLVPGRNYDVSDFLVSRLKKNLQAAHFHRAATYKEQLDYDFEEKGFANYSYNAEDGDMVVIVNLQAHQRITVLSIDVPTNQWGHTDGGYETRQMDKKRLNFTLELRPSPTYVYGNPLSPLPAPPCQHLQKPKAKIPLWYDIHDTLVPVMWDMALAAIVAVLTVRPGVGATELEEVMRPAMEVWELQVVLEWLVDAKAAKRVGQGFSVEDEWWWLALRGGESSERCASEDAGERKERIIAKRKGKGKERAQEGAQDEMTMDLE